METWDQPFWSTRTRAQQLAATRKELAASEPEEVPGRLNCFSYFRVWYLGRRLQVFDLQMIFRWVFPFQRFLVSPSLRMFWGDFRNRCWTRWGQTCWSLRACPWCFFARLFALATRVTTKVYHHSTELRTKVAPRSGPHPTHLDLRSIRT